MNFKQRRERQHRDRMMQKMAEKLFSIIRNRQHRLAVAIANDAFIALQVKGWTVQRIVQDGGPIDAPGRTWTSRYALNVETLKPSDPPGVPADTRVSDERGRRGSNPQPPDRQSGNT